MFDDFHGCKGITESFNKISISIMDVDKIHKLSYGEVRRPETINYRTFRPEKEGLFCAKIFGPVKSYECLCGKYKRAKYRGIVCEKCGVEITSSKVRRERMGHIDLVSPVVHIWFFRSLPSRISLILDLSIKSIERILYFEMYIVMDPGISPFSKHDLITESQYNSVILEYGEDAFRCMIGAEAIQEMLTLLDLTKTYKDLLNELPAINSELKRKKIIKRLRIIKDFINSDNSPKDMVLTAIPVLPPDLRPLVMLDGGRFATSDLNELYRRVINRNNRLRNLLALQAPNIIIANEKRMLQEAVDALFDNGRRNRMIKGANKQPYKSLSDMIKGKQGRFRQNLLGKRVDYSGRSVIVAGPHLKLYQCGIPKKMALELFKPFVYSKLETYGIVQTIKAAKRMVRNEIPEVWDILAEVIHQHPVLLNRAPTLHRLGIQAFEPILIEGKAIQLHPLVCTAFNSDFDGDQMAVHVPLSLEAQTEARVLMMSSNNIFNPSSGKPIIAPTKDIVLGIYYLVLSDKSKDSNFTMSFADVHEVDHALHNNHISLHTVITCRLSVYDDNCDTVVQTVKTTAGRLILYKILPKNPNIPFSVINNILTSVEMSDLIELVYKYCGQDETVRFSDALMQLGFKYATISGTSFGKNDMVVPLTKQTHLDFAADEVNKFTGQYQNGLITKSEKYNKVIDVWSRCSDRVATDMMEGISLYDKVSEINSIYMMAHSGARGSPAQIKQLAGMRGLMAKPSGEIIETPIKSNFREGLTVLEFFNSTHGARKGLADTALKTANSGYLTRRLVDVAQDCVVLEEDCFTINGLEVKSIIENGKKVRSVSDMVVGRVVSENIYNLLDQSVLIKSNTLITDELAILIDKYDVNVMRVRSPLMCEAKRGICSMCYGRDLSNLDMVSIGTAAGVIAAQSVGEPGTQLTMRTFHIGGAATRRIEASNLFASTAGMLKIIDAASVLNKDGNRIVLSRACEISIIDSQGVEKIQGNIPYGAILCCVDNDNVDIGDKLAEWDPYNVPILAEKSGVVQYNDLIIDVSLTEVLDDSTGMTNKVVSEWKQYRSKNDLYPALLLLDENKEILKMRNNIGARYLMPIKAMLNVDDGQKVTAGEVLARISRGSTKTRDITGGLQRVVELFEARRPNDHAIISEVDGCVDFAKGYYRSKRKVIVQPIDGREPVEYLIPQGRHIWVNQGDLIKKGDLLMDGDPDPHDMLRVIGIEALSEYILTEVQKVYRLQGVYIDNKHIEIILSQMLKRVEVADPGDTTLLSGEHIDLDDIRKINLQIRKEGKREAQYIRILLGITKASLQTKSFISAASFQETTRVLTEAALAGKVDELIGLKENVIAGRMLPVGTGFMYDKILKNTKHHVDDIVDKNDIDQDC